MRFAKASVLSCVIVFSGFVWNAQQASVSAQQRMVIASGRIRVGANSGSTRVPSYCLDQHRREPRPEDSLAFVLSKADAVVKTRGREIPLDTAIRDGIVRINGTGSFSELSVVNLGTDPIEVVFNGPVVVGPKAGDALDKGSIQQIFERLERIDQPGHDEVTQAELWEISGERHDSALRELANGDVDLREFTTREYGAEEVATVESEEFRGTVFRDGGSYEYLMQYPNSVPSSPLRFTIFRNRSGVIREAKRPFLERIEEIEFQRAAEASTADVAMLRIGTPVTLESEVMVQLGSNSVRLSSAEMQQWFGRGNVPQQVLDLIEDADYSSIVLWTSHYQQRDFHSGLKDRGDLVRSLQSQVADRQFVLDGDDPVSVAKARTLATVVSGQDIAVINDRDSLPEGYGELVDEIADELREARIQVLNIADARVIEAENIVIVTGLKNRDFMDMVESLRERGTLRNKTVLFFACGEGREHVYNRRLLDADDGPRAILYYTERINPSAVQMTLEQLSKSLNRNNSERSLPQLIRDSVMRFIEQEGEFLNHEMIENLRKLGLPVPMVYDVHPTPHTAHSVNQVAEKRPLCSTFTI